MPTLKSNMEYCQPVPHAGEDEDKLTRIDVDLRATQPPVRLREFVTKQLQRLLADAGCPSWGKDDGKWGPSSASQFTRFLQRTEQVPKYESTKSTTLYDVKKLFSGWIHKSDFDITNFDKPQYCEPVPKCNLNNEIAKILGAERENFGVRDLYLGIRNWNKDLPRQKSLQGAAFSEQDDDELNNVREKLVEAEDALRGLFRRAVEARNPATCGLCTLRVNYDRALLIGIKDITRSQLEKFQALWKFAEGLKRNILAKEALRQTKERGILAKELLKQVRLSEKRSVEEIERSILTEKQAVEELTGFIDRETIYLNELMEPVRRGIEADMQERSATRMSEDFRLLMEQTTCFVGEGPYAVE